MNDEKYAPSYRPEVAQPATQSQSADALLGLAAAAGDLARTSANLIEARREHEQAAGRYAEAQDRVVATREREGV